MEDLLDLEVRYDDEGRLHHLAFRLPSGWRAVALMALRRLPASSRDPSVRLERTRQVLRGAWAAGVDLVVLHAGRPGRGVAQLYGAMAFHPDRGEAIRRAREGLAVLRAGMAAAFPQSRWEPPDLEGVEHIRRAFEDCPRAVPLAVGPGMERPWSDGVGRGMLALGRPFLVQLLLLRGKPRGPEGAFFLEARALVPDLEARRALLGLWAQAFRVPPAPPPFLSPEAEARLRRLVLRFEPLGVGGVPFPIRAFLLRAIGCLRRRKEPPADPELLLLRWQLEAARALQGRAEEAAREAMAALHQACRALIPAAYDEARAGGRLPSTPAELAAFLAERVSACLADLERRAFQAKADSAGIERLREAAQEAQRWKEKAETLEGEKALLEARLRTKEDEIQRLREEAEALRRLLSEVRRIEPASSSAGSGDLSPEALAALRVLGETGWPLRKPVMERLLQEGALGRESVRPFQELEAAGLLEQRKPRGGSVGNTPYLLRLTERGREEFRRRFGREPAEPLLDRLLACHKSEEHVWLNLKAAEVLERFGFSVDLLPPVLRVEGREIAPDLAASRDGKTIYVECERTAKGEEIFRKWENMLLLNGDALYVFVPDTKIQSAVVSSVGMWTYRSRRKARLYVCNLAKLSEEAAEPWTLAKSF